MRRHRLAARAAQRMALAIQRGSDITIAGLTISGTYSQAEIQALRTNCEKLRDWGNDLRTAVNLLITRMEAHGLITSN